MIDITKCRDEECPLKESCYRFTAPYNEYGQSYFMDSPRVIHEEEGPVECDYYWETSVKCKHVRREGESCRLNDNCTYPNCK